MKRCVCVSLDLSPLSTLSLGSLKEHSPWISAVKVWLRMYLKVRYTKRPLHQNYY